MTSQLSSTGWRSIRGATLLLAGLFTLAAALGVSSPAWAHAELIATNPADGEVLPVRPSEIQLTYNEPVTALESAIRVFNNEGAQVASGGTAKDETVTLPLDGQLADGSYIVSWRITSADTHVTSGAFSFAVGEASVPPSTSVDAYRSSDSSLPVQISVYLLRALTYISVLGMAGVVAFNLWFLSKSASSGRRRLVSLLDWLVPIGVVSGLLLLPLESALVSGDSFAALASWAAYSGPPGGGHLLAWIIASGALLGCLFLQRTSRAPWRVGLSAFLAVLATSSFLFVGHTRTSTPWPLMLSMDWLHLLSAAIWIGGVLAILVSVWPKSGKTDTKVTQASEVAAAVSTFSFVAGFVFVLLAIAGVGMAWLVLGSVSALVDSAYGITLIVKLALVLLVVGVAGWNRYRLLPRVQKFRSNNQAWRHLRIALSWEAGLLIAILLATSVLVTANPNPESAAESGATVTEVQLSDDQLLEVSVIPAQVGANSIELLIRTEDGQVVEPVQLPKVGVVLPAMSLGPLQRTVVQNGPGSYAITSDFPLSGEWEIVVDVRLGTYENPVVRVPVEVIP